MKPITAYATAALCALAILVIAAPVAAKENGRGAVAVTCPGDCDGNGMVVINELIRGVTIALGLEPMNGCPAFANAADMVDVAQLIKGVNNALNGCNPDVDGDGIADLLTHKSGLTRLGDTGSCGAEFGLSFDAWVGAVISANLVGTPGGDLNYNNNNMCVLRALIETISGQGYVPVSCSGLPAAYTRW